IANDESDANFSLKVTGTSGSVARFSILGSGSTEFLTVASSGNVGIGTTNPISLLDVNTKLYVFSNGNVGIGTAVPGGRLDLGAGSTSDLLHASANTLSSGTMINFDGTGINNVTFSGDVIKINPNNTWSISSTISGNILDISPSFTTDAGTLTHSGDIAVFSSNCILNGGSCIDTANILELNQQYASASGEVLNIINSGQGFSLRVNDDGTDTDSTSFVIDAVGRASIGTTSPDSILEVASPSAKLIIRSTTSTASASLVFQPAGGASSSNQGLFTIRAGGSPSTGGERLEILNGAVTPLSLVTIASSGNVGIGTTNPLTKLDIRGTASASIFQGPLSTATAPTFTFSNDPNTGIFSPTADQLAIATGGTQRFLITSTGVSSSVNFEVTGGFASISGELNVKGGLEVAKGAAA
ncbi:MAG: hypothetical protein Q7K33_03970, partial [Candidatus Berkelbacteria bacterium]|nr:hypothetical protein [Candidatus Berkelbacteria bacterium]